MVQSTWGGGGRADTLPRCARGPLGALASVKITGAPCLVLLSNRGYGAMHGGALFRNARHPGTGLLTHCNPRGLVAELCVGRPTITRPVSRIRWKAIAPVSHGRP